MHSIVILFVVCGLSNGFRFEHQHGGNQIFNVPLNEDGKIMMYWSLDYLEEIVRFEIHIPKKIGWFALGFSDRGEFENADFCVLWKDWRGAHHLNDAWSDDNNMLFLDKKQHCRDFRIVTEGNVKKFTFSRDFDTCDDRDYVIEEGTTHIIWSKGRGPLFQLNGINVSTTVGNSGMVRVQLLKNTDADDELPADARPLDIRADKVEVPSNETTYWCHVHRLPAVLEEKHHVLQFAPAIQEGNEGIVHHMEVFHCLAPEDEEIPMYVGSCFAEDRPLKTQVCKRVLAAWAMGATAFTYPKEAGGPIGGQGFNPYVMLEVHYNNPEKRSGFVDSSGIRLHITSRLRSMDAGVMELGLEYTDKMAIPPGQERFTLSGHCVSECTAVSLPPTGIYVFGSQLHTHLTGARVVTRHFRNGRELLELNRDDHYSTHFQEIRRLKRTVNVLPGDSLITSCDYETLDRMNVTLGGFAISDEMCVNYIHYFPASPLEVCKSAISDQALASYFRFMNEWENQKTSPSLGINDNYHSIEWTPLRAQLLAEIYREAPLSMQCNMSNGDRFPGYWENTPVTSILSPLPPFQRDCRNVEED